MKKLNFIIILPLICALILYSTTDILEENTVNVNSANSVESLPTLIIDAGHGGFDGGASSADGIIEKDINLKISLYLNEYLQFFGFNTVMTREEDISLESDGLNTIREKKTSDIYNRMDLMEKTENALFISIHQNHYPEEKYKGIQVFYSPEFSEESSQLALCIQESVVNKLQPENERQIKMCGTSVYLMYNAVKPAVLVECGFLSNNSEAQLLNTDDYRKKLAFCIAAGIQDYVYKKV